MIGTVTVVGAAGRLGRAVVGEAQRRGLAVREIDRAGGLLACLLSGADAVICVIGPEPGSPNDRWPTGSSRSSTPRGRPGRVALSSSPARSSATPGNISAGCTG